MIATVCAIRLPPEVDSSEGEGEMSWRGEEGSTSRRGRLRTRIPGPVAFALRANCGPWFLSGFLLMFVAFLLRNPDVRPDSAFGPGVMIGIVIGAAGLGRVLGTLAASTLQRITPALAVVLALVAGAAAALLAALFYGVWTLALLGLIGRAGAGARQVLPRRHHPARHPHPGAGERVRPQRHHLPAGVGARRLRRHRDPARPAPARPRPSPSWRWPRGRRTSWRPRRAGAVAGGSTAQARAQQADIDTQPMPVQRRP